MSPITKATTAELSRRRDEAFARGFYCVFPSVWVERAKNAELWDRDGKRYIDFVSGIAVLNTGHLHPKVRAAAETQLEAFSHTCLTAIPYESAVLLGERLNELAPIEGPAKTLLVTTGAEAVENAVKIARYATGRQGVVAFTGGFHGRTYMAMGLTGKINPYKAGFGPFPAGVYHVPYPIEYHGITPADSLAALERLFTSDLEPEKVAAIVVEPVLGEGGFYPAAPEFLRQLRRIATRHGIILVVDEIQTGFGRTGKLFAIEHSGVKPDLVTMAKSMAGGFPLSAVVGRAEIMDAPETGGLGGTYAGSPVSIAAALAVLEVIEEEDVLDRAVAQGERLMAGLRDLAGDFDAIGNVRGLGAMVAMELVRDGGEPDTELTSRLVQACAERGLLILSCGVRGNVIRFLAPLTAESEIIDEGLEILRHVMTTEVVGAAVVSGS